MRVKIIVELEADHPFPPAIQIREALEGRWPTAQISFDESDPEVAVCIESTRQLLS